MDARGTTINWPLVDKLTGRENLNTHWRVYGMPRIMATDHSAFSAAAPMPRWTAPPKAIVSAAINGAFFTHAENPNQPLTPAEIIRSAEGCIAAGAQVVHVHVRDARGYNTLDTGAFREVLGHLRTAHPDVAFDACLVAVNDEESAQMDAMIGSGLVDGVPVNTTALILGDNLFVKPPHVIIEKTRRAIDAGLTPQIAVYSDADVDNARRYLIDSGLIRPPFFWLVLSGLPGCSPMYSPETMVDGFLRMVRLIRHIDPQSVIMSCAGGRASLHLANLALLMGCHVRVGMEDTVWKWPHRDDLIDSNAAAFTMARTMVELLGRDLMSAAEYRALLSRGARQAVIAAE
jgi:3-keto-5-aminohexanoate cleavage enzyme